MPDPLVVHNSIANGGQSLQLPRAQNGRHVPQVSLGQSIHPSSTQVIVHTGPLPHRCGPRRPPYAGADHRPKRFIFQALALFAQYHTTTVRIEYGLVPFLSQSLSGMMWRRECQRSPSSHNVLHFLLMDHSAPVLDLCCPLVQLLLPSQRVDLLKTYTGPTLPLLATLVTPAGPTWF